MKGSHLEIPQQGGVKQAPSPVRPSQPLTKWSDLTHGCLSRTYKEAYKLDIILSLKFFTRPQAKSVKPIGSVVSILSAHS